MGHSGSEKMIVIRSLTFHLVLAFAPSVIVASPMFLATTSKSTQAVNNGPDFLGISKGLETGSEAAAKVAAKTFDEAQGSQSAPLQNLKDLRSPTEVAPDLKSSKNLGEGKLDQANSQGNDPKIGESMPASNIGERQHPKASELVAGDKAVSAPKFQYRENVKFKTSREERQLAQARIDLGDIQTDVRNFFTEFEKVKQRAAVTRIKKGKGAAAHPDAATAMGANQASDGTSVKLDRTEGPASGEQANEAKGAAATLAEASKTGASANTPAGIVVFSIARFKIYGDSWLAKGIARTQNWVAQHKINFALRLEREAWVALQHNDFAEATANAVAAKELRQEAHRTILRSASVGAIPRQLTVSKRWTEEVMDLRDLAWLSETRGQDEVTLLAKADKTAHVVVAKG